MPFEQDALVRDVLVDQQQSGAVRRDDEAVVQLADRVDLVGGEGQVLRRFELRACRVGAAPPRQPMRLPYSAGLLGRIEGRGLFSRRGSETPADGSTPLAAPKRSGSGCAPKPRSIFCC